MSVYRLRIRTALLIVALLFSFERSAWSQPVDVEAARKEGRLVAYGTIVPKVMDPVHRGFEKKYGIKVEYWRANATQVAERALSEWQAGRPGFDLVFAIRGAQLLLKKYGVFAKYTPPSAEIFPTNFKDKDGMLVAWRHTPVGLLYNTALVKPGEQPATLDDLLQPKWKGKIVMPDPSRHTSTAQFLVSLKKIKGDRWLSYVEGLAKQGPLLRESFAPVPTDIVKGEAPLGLTYLQYVHQVKGPLGYVLMDKILTDTNDLGLSARATSPNAARLYIDYLCSPEAQKSVAELGEFVLAPGVFPPIKDADKITANSVFMDNPTAEEYKKLSAEFRQLFLGK